MPGMVVVIGLAVGLVLAGLVMAWLSGSLRQPTLAAVVYWAGVVLVVVGLVLLITPVLVWLSAQLRSALGVP